MPEEMLRDKNFDIEKFVEENSEYLDHFFGEDSYKQDHLMSRHKFMNGLNSTYKQDF